MSLYPCKECGQEISDKASACTKCGAKVLKTKWWLWIPLGLVALFILYGMSIPEYKARAMKERRVCEEMAKQGITTFGECNRIYSEAIVKGASK